MSNHPTPTWTRSGMERTTPEDATTAATTPPTTTIPGSVTATSSVVYTTNTNNTNNTNNNTNTNTNNTNTNNNNEDNNPNRTTTTTSSSSFSDSVVVLPPLPILDTERRHYHPHRGSTTTTTTTTTSHTEAYSPFLNNILRFSPKQRHTSTTMHRMMMMLHDTEEDGRLVESVSPTEDDHRHTGIHNNNNNKNNNNKNHHQDTPPHDATYVPDGIPIHPLRALIQSSLYSSPSTASYYANIVYCKTQSASDAYSLAQAHYFNHKYDACLRIIEESQLLQYHVPHHTHTSSSSSSSSSSSYSDTLLLLWDTILLATLALLAKCDYTTLIDLLEDTCRLPPPPLVLVTQHYPMTRPGATGNPHRMMDDSETPPQQQQAPLSLPLEDDDDIGWMTLKQIISSSLSSTTTSSTPTPTTQPNTNIQIHPLSLICYYRGLGYYETGCTTRAATYWKLSLRMDSYHQLAWQSLMEHQLLSNTEAYEFIMYDEQLTWNHPEQDWIQALYLSRIDFTTTTMTTPTMTTTTSTTSGTTTATAKDLPPSQQPHPTTTTTHSLQEDVSSIHFSALSPIPTVLHERDSETTTTRTNEKEDILVDHEQQQQQQQQMNTITESLRTTTIQNDIDQAFYNLFHVYKLQNSSQVLAVAARRAYRRYDWKSSLLYCQDLAQLDPTVEEASFYYIATLVMLGHKRVLFRLAHEWVDATPKAARAWFAVGAYYYCIHRYHIAQRHFCRATRMNPQCTEAWIALGCSFAACDESDQALASFRAAQRLSPGEHSSLLYMGMEYIRTNHLVLASHFLQAALSASGGDPLCLHEMGVLAAHKGDHTDAIYYFCQALSTIGGGGDGGSARGASLQENIDLCGDAYWEPTIFNLGHSYRKCRQFNNALLCFHRCITLCPEKYSTYSALAFTKHLMGEIDNAISFYHKALGLKPDDPFCTDMLSRAFHDQIETTTTTQDIFNIGLPPRSYKTETQLNTTDSIFLSTPNVMTGRKKDDSAIGDDMELDDVDMSVAS